MSGEGKNEVGMTLDIIQLMLKELKQKCPGDRMFLYSYSQFKIAKTTNPKLIFNNLGTYLLVPFSSAIESLSLTQLYCEVTSSRIYLENKDEYEDSISNMVFKPLKLYSDEDKLTLMKNINTMRLLYIAYYKRRGVDLPLDRHVILSPNDLKSTKKAFNEFVQKA